MLRYDQVPWRSKHPLLTGHTRRELDTDFDCGFSRLPDLRVLILTADCSVNLVWTHWFLRLIWAARRMRQVGRGCLLLHGTWSHLRYIQRSVYANSLICISYRTYEIYYCLLFLSFYTPTTKTKGIMDSPCLFILRHELSKEYIKPHWPYMIITFWIAFIYIGDLHLLFFIDIYYH
jgi:hypothetical protein